MSVLKFLAFEQTFKNALTGLGIGGAKGGSDFDPREASDAEIRRFCHSFMTELQRHVSPERDVPAGDIASVLARLDASTDSTNASAQMRTRPTGKPLELSGSPLREEATGWGVVYFAERVLARRERSIVGQRCLVSGAGNFAVQPTEKRIESGARVLALSDREGFVHAPDGFTRADLEMLRSIKDWRGSIAEFAERSGFDRQEGRPWRVACDAAFPCATQNELGGRWLPVGSASCTSRRTTGSSTTRRVRRAADSHEWQPRCCASESDYSRAGAAPVASSVGGPASRYSHFSPIGVASVVTIAVITTAE